MLDDRNNTKAILEGQLAHALWLALLLAGLWGVSRLDGFWVGSWLGLSTRGWVLLTVGFTVVHQVYVWLAWRLELYGSRLSRSLGKAAFPIYAVIFAVLILSRPALITALAISNTGSLEFTPPWLPQGLALLMAFPTVYLFYSVKRYFGFKRAFGIDHFDEGYRSAGLVRRGIFRWSSNSMYIFGFFLLWIPGLSCRSSAALAVAAFSHLYIWVHFRYTEGPDMREIYGSQPG